MRFPLLVTVLVCATVAQGASISIQNPGFETANLTISGNGTYSNLIVGSTFTTVGGTLANWTATSTTTDAAAGGFDPSPGGVNWTSQWWSGNNIGYVQADGGTVSLSQTLTATLQDNTAYTLSALIGRRQATQIFNYDLELFAGSTLVASASNLSLSSNSSGMDSALYTSAASDPDAGQAMEVVLTSTAPAGGIAEAFFDNVSLNAVSTAAPAPEPSTMLLGGLVLVLAGLLGRARLKPAR